MKCPACGGGMTEKTVDGIVVDTCEGGCGGLWFDNFELIKVDEEHETHGEELLEISRNPSIKIDQSETRYCPRCDKQPMRKFYHSVKQAAEIDECPACGGIFLDAGELNTIRTNFKTEDERKKAADKYFGVMFSKDFSKLRAESEKEHKTSKTIARLFRFICPSYYIPGKQKWGAF